MYLYKNARIYTVDQAGTTAEAILVDGPRIRAVGAFHDLRRTAHQKSIDLGGKTVIPGIVDAHHHLGMAVVYRGAVDCRPARASSIATLQQLLARDKDRGDDWLVGWGYHPWLLREGRYLTRDDLDAVSTKRPILVVQDSFHEGVANTRALEIAGIGPRSKDPPGGALPRDRRGVPNGRLVENALARVEHLARASLMASRKDNLLLALEQYQHQLFQNGITRICDPAVPKMLLEFYRAAREAGRLRIPVVAMPVSESGYLSKPWDKLAGAATGEGEDALRIGPLKLFFDGADRCALCLSVGQAIRTMAGTLSQCLGSRSLQPLRSMLRTNMSMGRDFKWHTGILFYQHHEARDMLLRASERGFSVAVHAIGNEAVAAAIDAMAPLRAKLRGTPRIEHACFLNRELVKKIADHEVSVVAQPSFVPLMHVSGVPNLPGIRIVALRSLIEAGVAVAASSDAPVTDYNPFLTAQHAVTRSVAPGRQIQAAEAISSNQWLAMATREAARACDCLDVTGTLEPGKRADFLVLTQDPLTCPPGRLGDIQVEQTVLAGETVFNKED